MAQKDRVKLYIGKVPENATEDDVRIPFARYGKISRVQLKTGYAFVEYEDGADAETALEKISENGITICDDEVTVQRANKSKTPAPSNVLNKGGCFKCGKEGHWVRDCPNANKDGGDKDGKKDDRPRRDDKKDRDDGRSRRTPPPGERRGRSRSPRSPGHGHVPRPRSRSPPRYGRDYPPPPYDYRGRDRYDYPPPRDYRDRYGPPPRDYYRDYPPPRDYYRDPYYRDPPPPPPRDYYRDRPREHPRDRDHRDRRY